MRECREGVAYLRRVALDHLLEVLHDVLQLRVLLQYHVRHFAHAASDVDNDRVLLQTAPIEA